MSNQYFTFYYSPSRQGFDSSTWRTLFGTPSVSSNRLSLVNAGIIHYGDIGRGDASFLFVVPSPAAGLSKKFGFYQPGLQAYAWFNISGATFTAECSNGTTTTTVVITWQSAWTNASTEFRVKWEAGIATFYVGGIQQAQISDASVTGKPMSLYITNEGTDNLQLVDINVQTIQSYMLSEGNENSNFEILLSENEQINITEAVTMLIPTLFAPADGGNIFDGITLSENLTVSAPA